MAREVVTELQRQGFVTYEEVSLGGGGSKRADIVATRGPVVAVVECKTSVSLRLLDQITDWIGRAHLVIGAAPGRAGAAAARYCKAEGLGLWRVSDGGVVEDVAPRLNRSAYTTQIRKRLCDEQRSQEFAAAGSQGGYWTPFAATCKALRKVVEREPGIELRAALRQIKHHYASSKSAMSALPVLIRRGVIAGIEVEGRPLRLWIVGQGPAVESERVLVEATP